VDYINIHWLHYSYVQICVFSLYRLRGHIAHVVLKLDLLYIIKEQLKTPIEAVMGMLLCSMIKFHVQLLL